MASPITPKSPGQSRRHFLSQSAAGAVAAGAALDLGFARMVHAAGSDVIKIALIGCGGRGRGAISQALNTEAPVKLVALADAFADRIDLTLEYLQKAEHLKDRLDVPKQRQFVGLDAYQKAIDSGVDLVVLTTSPGFRPQQYTAAVKAGKHVFMEKPCCVDGPGYRKLLLANAEAKQKNLCVGVGYMRRHQASYVEKIRQIREGAVGEIKYVRTYFNMPGNATGQVKKPDETEMAYQIRHWNAFCWLSGDHFVEQNCHSIDVVNWVLGSTPLRCNGMGGRQFRVGKGTGDIYDHFCVEYVYPAGVRYFSQARQIAGAWQHVSETVHGVKDTMLLGEGPYAGFSATDDRNPGGKRIGNPYQQEHDDLFAAIRSGKPYFEGDYGATSGLTAVMGRMAAYSGQVVSWEQASESKLSLLPERLDFDAMPPAKPDKDGRYPVAIPGITKAF